jgi:heme exporter protein B
LTAFMAVIRRDLRLAAAAGGDLMTLLLFFVLVGALMPFAIGPDRALLARIAPGIVWVAVLLAFLLGIDRLFRTDREDGSLRAFRNATLSMEAIVFAKLVAAWLSVVLPLVVATPIHALLLGMSLDVLGRTLVSLLVGTPALLSLGAIGAAVTVSLRRGGLIGPVIILPLAIPILIFGVGAAAPPPAPGVDRAALLFLCALSLALTAIAPFAAGLALKLSED